MSTERTTSNYERYWQAPFNRPEHYPLGAAPDPTHYRPAGAWLGRLIMPALPERSKVMGTLIEVHHAPPEHSGLVGRKARLRWAQSPDLNARFWGVTRNVHFNDEARQAVSEGVVLAERLDGLILVNPLESLTAAHPNDDVIVRLDGAVTVDLAPADGGLPIIAVTQEPTQITGRHYALVRFVAPTGAGDSYTVRHYDRAKGDFSGPEEVVRLPEVVPDGNSTRNSTAVGIERSPVNEAGWYVYGALDGEGRFVVQSLVPRSLLRLEAQESYEGVDECMTYLRPRAWRRAAAKGQATVALLCGEGLTAAEARASWHEGDEALLIHLFGGIGGPSAEPAARTPLYWGHFAFGRATVVREPLADELVFDIVYHQVYAHNADGLTAGALHYTRYSGDRQYGWLGSRPIQDILLKLDAITGHFEVYGTRVSSLDQIVRQLEVMTARYRIADGRGGTRVGPTNNCAQDSAQALFAAVRNVGKVLAAQSDVRAELTDTPEEAQRLAELTVVDEEIQRVLLPWGSARSDWEYGMATLGSDQGGGIVGTFSKVVTSWRTMLPPVAARALAEVFFEHGASAWVLRSYQVGGDDPSIEPFVPNI